MEFLTHNFIADMRGPDFLGFYVVTALVVIVVCWGFARRKDPTRGLKPAPIPPRIDPYEIAYLRGGSSEVLRLVLLSLMHRGYIEISGQTELTIHQRRNHPDTRHLSQMEERVFGWFDQPQMAPDLFAKVASFSDLQDWCAQFDKRLLDEQLLSKPEARRGTLHVAGCGAAVLLALGGYRLAIALSRGRTNVGFLIALMTICTVVVFAVSYASVGRASARGKSWIERLQLAFEKLKSRATQAAAAADDATLLIIASVFGIGTLAGTTYASFTRTFRKSARSGSSCGSACDCGDCGSTGSSGSSSGGGCGGGGGGCGGCGGGGD